MIRTHFIALTLLFVSFTGIKGQTQPLTLPGLLHQNAVTTSGFDKETKGNTLALTATKPGGSVRFSAGDKAWNFSTFVFLVCEIQNLSAHEQFVECHLNGDYWSTGAMYVPAQSTRKIKTLILRKEYSEEQLKLFPKMNGLPGGAARLWCSYTPDSIVHFSFDFPRSQSGDRVVIKKIAFETPYKEYTGKAYQALLPFVDEFGQYIPSRYPGKISHAKEILKADEKEESDLKKHPENKTWDQYGGWADGPQLAASGHFRIEKYQGKWWLVTPTGHLFWSHGITCVAGGDGTTVNGREAFYRPLNLPEDTDSSVFLSTRNGTTEVSYWKLNMYRKWGKDYEEKMIDKTIRRLKSWQINTIANWSNEQVIREKKIPYTAVIHTQHGHFTPDPFAPDFERSVAQSASHSSAADDEWCIGYFVDNEISWGSTTYLGTLTLQGRYPHAKEAFKNRLIERYESLAELNQKWGSSFTTWDEWMQSDSIYSGATNDLTDFTVHFANVYFRTVKNGLKAQAPEKLYLGCRFNYGDYAGNAGQKWIVDIAAKYCDIVSFNRYQYAAYSLRPSAPHDFPMMIGEFHFGGLDRGLLHCGLRYGGDQDNRADLYTHYVEDALENPYLVGTHWFQYNDQAVTGRGDGENYQIGFVNVYDAPNWELVKAARAMGEQMYQIRSK